MWPGHEVQGGSGDREHGHTNRDEIVATLAPDHSEEQGESEAKNERAHGKNSRHTPVLVNPREEDIP